MPKQKDPSRKNLFERFATWAAHATGSSYAFITALTIFIAWALTGPIFHYSENWQLVINTGTTIITFLMVFLIQKAQNKDSLATQLKLNELVAAHEFASNRIVNVEGLTEEEMKVLAKYYQKLAQLAKLEDNIHTSRSIDEAEGMHELKKLRRTQSNRQASRLGASHSSKTSVEHTKTNTAKKHSTTSEAKTSTPESDKPNTPKRNRRRPPRKGPPKPAATE